MPRKEKARGAQNVTSAASRSTPLGEQDPNTYNCSGNFPSDFGELWSRSGADKLGMPVIKTRAKPPKIAENSGDVKEGESEEACGDLENGVDDVPTTYTLVENSQIYRPSLQCEYEKEETRQSQTNYAKEIFARGWKVDNNIIQIVKQCHLERLTTINFWNAGLNELAVTTLSIALKSLPTVKTLYVEGNHIPDTEPFHLFISDENSITKLWLRNNKMTQVGARNIARALAPFSTSSATTLTTINLSFNNIDDQGAKHIAKALRTNRSLLSLSLASNYIGNEGACAIASSLTPFALTHDEVVERRKILASHRPGLLRSVDSRDRPGSHRSGTQSSSRQQRGSSKKKEKEGKGGKGKEGEGDKKKDKKATGGSEQKSVGRGKKSEKSGGGGGKESGKKSSSEQDDLDDLEPVHPLIDAKARLVDGKITLPGCMSLVSLNLSRNEIGLEGLNEFYSVVSYHAMAGKREKGYKRMPGLLKLYLHKNLFDEYEACWLNIQEILLSRDPISSQNDESSQA